MKKLNAPTVDDLSVLMKMKDNPKIASQPYIKNEYNTMREKYIHYNDNSGNPWVCSGNEITKNLKEKLEYHYERPYRDLNYIKKIRDEGSPDVCPFCGSSKTGTLDHYLPQADYPEWIIYSKNLVPACDCNSKRQNNVKGKKHNQRILHPYFDDCLKGRIVRAIFTGDFKKPNIDIIPIKEYGTPSETIEFHVNTIIKQTTIVQWMNAKWQSMKRNPQSVISAIPKTAGLITINELDCYLYETLERKDDEHGTMNNWYSMFISGIISSKSAKAWLLETYNGIKNGTINPLD